MAIEGGRAGPSELRIGLVLYGGVSLAVYIFGVVVEIHRLLKSSQEGKGAYFELLRRHEIDTVTIDIAAGTSAGGINGILLAKALSSGADLGPLRNVWLDVGDLEQLLQPPSEAAPESLLQSQRFEDELNDALARLDTGSTGPGPKAGVFDLFVSATHIRGGKLRFEDSLTSEILTRQHRYVFQLRLRGDRYDPVREPASTDPEARKLGYDSNQFTDNGVLTRLARATSAFPFAFEPVRLGRADGLLGPQDEPTGWFADGGILNNKPFTEALDTIYARRSEQPVNRWLFSIDPDPPQTPYEAVPGPKPPFDQVALRSVATNPRYQSIMRDLVSLRIHNKRVEATEEVVRALEAGFADEPEEDGGPGSAYSALRRQALGVEVADFLTSAVEPDDPSRFDAGAHHLAFRRLTEGVLRDMGGEARDPSFERRRAYYLIKLLSLAIVSPEQGDDTGLARAELARARTLVWAEFERLSDRLWTVLAGSRIEADGPEAAAEEARPRVAAALSSTGDPPSLLNEELGRLTVRLPPAPGESETNMVALAQVAAGFDRRDAVLLPAETLGDLRHRDYVNHAQISPRAARRIPVPGDRKLGGATVGHFGGFLDRNWRSQDLMWGRLDAAEMVVRAIESGPRAREVAGPGPEVDRVQDEVIAEEWPEIADTDWRAVLVERFAEKPSVLDVDGSYLVRVGMKSAAVVRRMLVTAAQTQLEGGAKNWIRARVLRALAAALAFVLALVYLPATAFTEKGRPKEKIIAAIGLIPFLWGLITLTLALAGVVPFDEVALPAIIGIAFYPAALGAYWLLGRRLSKPVNPRG